MPKSRGSELALREDAVDLIVDASPERALFVEMLTRDIDLIPAIMDLIDNSIDGARALADGNDASPFWVELEISKTKFVIRDNCGGIDLDVAKHYAFRFGRPKEYKGTKRSVGQFGVGMKRALFKLGDYFQIESRAASTRFDMEVNVAEWVLIDSHEWTFEMSSAERGYSPARLGRGTTITVKSLHESVSDDFADRGFLSLLREQIRIRHQAALAEGLRLTLNSENLAGLDRELLEGPNFAPVNRAFVVKSEFGDVAVRIVAGLTEVERAGVDDGNAENFRSGTDAGWWIFCNDRLLLMRERSRLTGWGDTLPNYHPQYRQFRGYVYMSAVETEALPWNTTKTGIDEDSRVWRQVQAQVKIAGAEVVAVLNRIKAEGQSASSEDEAPTLQAAKQATLVPLSNLSDNERFKTPPPIKFTRQTMARKPPAKKMQYEVPLERFGLVAERLRTDVVAEVGRRTFDYYFEREVEG